MNAKFGIYTTFKLDNNLIEPLEKSGKFEIEQNPSISVDRDTLKLKINGKHGIICNSYQKIDKEILDCAGDNFKLVCTNSVGYEHIDADECKKRNITIIICPYPDSGVICEFGIALLLNLSRRISESAEATRGKNWSTLRDTAYYYSGVGVRNSTIGIFGLGAIGYGIAKRLKSFEPNKIIYHNRHRNPEADKLGCEYVSFETLVSTSDFLICTCSANKDNQKIFNKSVFDMMKPSLIFINIARGSIVDHDDLYQALATKKILGAGLDVFTPSPLPEDHKLYTLSNCVITPHIAWSEYESINERYEVLIKDVLNFFDNKPVINELKI